MTTTYPTHTEIPLKHVVQPEVGDDNFNNDFGALGESMEDEEDILEDGDHTDWDPRNPDEN